MNEESPFERFVNQRLTPDQLEHIAVDPSSGSGEAIHYRLRQKIDRRTGAIGPLEIDRITEDEAKRINEEAPKSFRGVYAQVNISDETRAKINEAVKKAASDMTARAYGVEPPVDTSQLRPSLTYAALMSTLHKMRSDHAAYKREQEAEEYRIRQRILAQPNGEAFLARVDHFAEANGVEWIDAARIVTFADIGEAAVKAFERLAKIGSTFSSGVDQAMKESARLDEEARLFGGDAPTNRAERRRSKHKKPIQDGDQVWKNRNSNRRRQHRRI